MSNDSASGIAPAGNFMVGMDATETSDDGSLSMTELYLSGRESRLFWSQPGVLPHCGAESLPSCGAQASPYLTDYLACGPAELELCSIPHDYVPHVLQAQARGICDEHGLSMPIEVLVAHAPARRSGKKLHSAVFPKGVAPAQFVEYAEGLYLASPELTLLQAAESCTLHELALLCSTYMAVYESSPDGSGIAFRQQLTSRERLAAFARDSKGAKHAEKLLAACGLAFEGAASPYEIYIAALFAWPTRAGGYGLGAAQLNKAIDTSGFFEDGGTHYRLCDCYFDELKTSIEYDGRSAHQRRSEQGEDQMRHNELTAAGVTEYLITTETLHSTRYLDSIALAVGKLHGLHRRSLGPSFRKRQNALVRALRSIVC